nr:MAG TPA: hypothetical protein [Caudoviricetes sp.]
MVSSRVFTSRRGVGLRRWWWTTADTTCRRLSSTAQMCRHPRHLPLSPHRLRCRPHRNLCRSRFLLPLTLSLNPRRCPRHLLSQRYRSSWMAGTPSLPLPSAPSRTVDMRSNLRAHAGLSPTRATAIMK